MTPSDMSGDSPLLARALGAPHEAVRAARSKVSMTIARLIAAEVADRQLAPGSPLPNEHEMATIFGVGRPSIREALRILEAQGLVTIRSGQGGGPIVREPTVSDYGQSVSLFLQMGRVTYRDVLAMHTKLAGLIAELAAERVAAGETDLVEELIDSSRSELDGEDDGNFLAAGSHFHDVMLRMTGNATLAQLSGAVSYVWAVRTARLHGGHWQATERQEIADEHRHLGAAIRAGSVRSARRLAEEHFQRQVAHLIEVQPGLLDDVVDWR